MSVIIRWVLTAILLATAPAFSKQRPPDEYLVYKTVGDAELKLHLFRPEGDESNMKRPCVVFFFGGGWVGGTPRQFYSYCEFFNSLGFVAVSAEYRVKKVHNSTPFESVQDARSAIRWVRANAEKLGVDPSRIIASGGSAGGHLAACTGVISGHEESGEADDISSVPNAMILFNPVLDTTEAGYGLSKVGEERKTDISPCHHVSGGKPPCIVFHGMADQTVPYENAERFVRLMKEAGNDCELKGYEGRDHGFFCRGKFIKTDRPIIYEQIKKWNNDQNN